MQGLPALREILGQQAPQDLRGRRLLLLDRPDQLEPPEITGQPARQARLGPLQRWLAPQVRLVQPELRQLLLGQLGRLVLRLQWLGRLGLPGLTGQLDLRARQ